MSKASEEALFAKALKRRGNPRVELLADPGLWTVVFFDAFRINDDDEDEHPVVQFFGDAPTPSGLEQQPLFSFAFPNEWQWHVLFHGSSRGGLSHAISNGRHVEAVVHADAHPEAWSELTFSELRKLSTSVTDEETPPQYFAPIACAAAVPASEDERVSHERWFADAVAASGIIGKRKAKSFAQALRLTDRTSRRPTRTKVVERFLKDVL
jgi:hypothetical protein